MICMSCAGRPCFCTYHVDGLPTPGRACETTTEPMQAAVVDPRFQNAVGAAGKPAEREEQSKYGAAGSAKLEESVKPAAGHSGLLNAVGAAGKTAAWGEQSRPGSAVPAKPVDGDPSILNVADSPEPPVMAPIRVDQSCDWKTAEWEERPATISATISEELVALAITII